MCRTLRCHSAREDLLLTLSMCTNKPILDKIISALGVGAEPHRQTPGLCLSVCPLCSYSDASGDRISLATVDSATAAATRSPMVRAPLHCFSSISETRRFSADCCRFERMYEPMRLDQIKRSRRVLESEDGSVHVKKRDRNALALRFGHFIIRLSTKAAPLQHAQHRSHHINSDQAASNTATALECDYLSHLNFILFLQLSPIAFVWV